MAVNNNDSQVDTQEDLLGRLATVLNGADPGVSAQVVASQQDVYNPQHHLLHRTLRLSIRGSDPSVDFSLAAPTRAVWSATTT